MQHSPQNTKQATVVRLNPIQNSGLFCLVGILCPANSDSIRQCFQMPHGGDHQHSFPHGISVPAGLSVPAEHSVIPRSGADDFILSNPVYVFPTSVDRPPKIQPLHNFGRYPSTKRLPDICANRGSDTEAGRPYLRTRIIQAQDSAATSGPHHHYNDLNGAKMVKLLKR